MLKDVDYKQCRHSNDNRILRWYLHMKISRRRTEELENMVKDEMEWRSWLVQGELEVVNEVNGVRKVGVDKWR